METIAKLQPPESRVPDSLRAAPVTTTATRPLGVVMLLRWLGVGGTQRQALALSRELISMGVNVSVLTRRTWATPRSETIDTVPVHHVGFPARGWLRAPSFFLGSLLWMLRHRREFDVVHACNLPSALTAACLAPLLGKPVIVKLPNTGLLGDFHRRAFGRLRSRLLRRTIDRFLALNVEIEKELAAESIPPGRIVRMPNGVEAAATLTSSSLRQQLGIAPTDPVVVAVARLVPVKGLDWLLTVWRTVRVELPGARLLIVGDGPDRSRLEDLAGQLGVADSVLFLGERKSVRPYLAISDLFVLPSRKEGMSNSLLEAMAHGLPSVSTDIPANRELIEHGVDGLLVRFGEDRPLADAVLTLLRDPALRRTLGRAAHHKVEQQFTLRAVAARHRDLYRDLRASA